MFHNENHREIKKKKTMLFTCEQLIYYNSTEKNVTLAKHLSKQASSLFRSIFFHQKIIVANLMNFSFGNPLVLTEILIDFCRK
jgi:hypothetical protein